VAGASEDAVRRLLDASGPGLASRLKGVRDAWQRCRHTGYGVEQAIAHNLLFKIHTGYYAGTGRMPLERIRPGHLCALLMRYSKARFVLMHKAYPYSDELIAIAKHYPNAYIDMCWAWSIDPYSACDTLRRTIHAVPSNKVFAFGGDAWWPSASVAYAVQARAWLSRALEAEVNDGLLVDGLILVLLLAAIQSTLSAKVLGFEERQLCKLSLLA
jgi:hypothetical protein